jgi:uncharacterized protein YjbI with pentapeptide repeats
MEIGKQVRGETMANQECLDVIQQGAAAWNQWRNNQGEIYFDLSGADLSHMELRGVDLSGVYLQLVNLRKADLSEANLYRAYLSEANLIETRLDKANLNMANLYQATLDNASLCDTNLSRADLREAQMHMIQAENAIFRGADLSQSNLDEADLRGSDLHEARINDAQLNGAILSRCDLRTLDLGNIDLEGADLGWANLEGVNLSGANLQATSLQYARLSSASLNGANLNDANLEEANLNSAYLGDAHMRRAYLRCADLSFADLSGANMTGTDMSGADLLRTNFTNTILAKADFSQAIMGWTIFGNVNLSTAQGLRTIRHHGGLILDIDTLLHSANELPESFLRAANLPLDIATRLSTIPSPDQSTYCICAASIDQEFADRLHTSLQEKGIRCWYVLVDLKVGEKQQELLDELIRLHDHILLILSEHAITSEWISYAMKTIQDRESWENKKLLLPISLDDALLTSQENWLSSMRRARNVTDFRSWRDAERYRKALTRLLRNLNAEREVSGRPSLSQRRRHNRRRIRS